MLNNRIEGVFVKQTNNIEQRNDRESDSFRPFQAPANKPSRQLCDNEEHHSELISQIAQTRCYE